MASACPGASGADRLNPVRQREILAARLATQRLTGPAASAPEQVVGELLAVQAQDAPLARLAVAQRADCHVGAVAEAIDAGRVLRTHLLRPTWHYVLAEDLPWLIELTGRRMVSGDASRLRQLGLDPDVLARGLDAVAARLGAGPATRPEVVDALVAAGVVPRDREVGSRAAHILMHAEARALVASGPLRGGEHTYELYGVPLPGRDRADAAAELTRRFFASHGPASIRDLMRWVNLTKGDINRALAELGDAVAHVDADGVRLYYVPDSAQTPVRGATWLLSTFDEGFLSYRDVPWPRASGHPLGDSRYRWSEAGGGPVLDDLADVGTWKRTLRPGRLTLRLDLATSLSDAARRRIDDAVRDAAERMAPPGTELLFEEGPVPFGVR